MRFLLDNFDHPDGVSSFGTEWILFSDQVMGGHSQACVKTLTTSEGPCLHLQGQVNTQDGGFIQVALPLVHSRYLFDAAHFQGVYLTAKSPHTEGYYIHLRTRELSMPWQHYAAPLRLTPEWKEYQLPFDMFYPVSTGHPLNLERLTRIGLVAANQDFEADLKVAEIGFY